MKRLSFKINSYIPSIIALSLTVGIMYGCQSEKIVQSTEYIERIEVIELPPDTILLVDSVTIYDSVTVFSVDTLYLTDTLFVLDTVQQAQCSPNEFLAFTALQYYTDDQVFAFINAEFGFNGGWVLYLSAFQVEKAKSSASTYQFSGVIDYWTTDWQLYYPLEFYWVMVYTGGDPSDPLNWRMEEPASGAGMNTTPGLTLISRIAPSN